MDEKLKNVREDIEKTRNSLIEKVELLDERVEDTIAEGRLRVKRAVDFRYHVEQRPWPILGASVAVGYALRRATATKPNEEAPTPGAMTPHPAAEPMASPAPGLVRGPDPVDTASKQPGEASTQEPEDNAKEESAVTDRLMTMFGQELQMLKGVAVGALANLVRDMVGQISPTASAYVRESIHSAGEKFTGQRLDVDPPAQGAQSGDSKPGVARQSTDSGQSADGAV